MINNEAYLKTSAEVCTQIASYFDIVDNCIAMSDTNKQYTINPQTSYSPSPHIPQGSYTSVIISPNTNKTADMYNGFIQAENNDFELYNIVPLVIVFFTQFEILYNSANNETFKLKIDNLDLKMRICLLNNAYYPTLTAYCLSSVDRIELRKKYFGIRTIDNLGALCLSLTV